LTPPRRAGRKERKSVLRPRTTSRLAAVQALYQLQMTDRPASLVVEEFVTHRLTELEDTTSFGVADEDLFRELTLGTAEDLEAVDGIISNTLVEGWSLERLESTLLAILRVGAYELLNHGQTPGAVVISEYVDVTHAFYDEAAVGLVNGVLDRVAQVVRERDGGDDDEVDDEDVDEEKIVPRNDQAG
jgi:transcription antitermination protein NusB